MNLNILNMLEKIARHRLIMTLFRYLHPRGAVSFWHTHIDPVYYQYETLDSYYIDLRAKMKYLGPYDAEGVPMLNYFGVIGTQYNPCAIAQWGLGAWQCWHDGDETAEALFWRAVEWLRKNLTIDPTGRGFWYYKFNFDAYGLRTPWISALAQAQGISLLLRAYKARGLESDLVLVKKACAAMLSPLEEGGMLLKYDGNTILEEVVADRPTAILDGMMFAIFGLQDYCYLIEDKHAMTVLEQCYDTLERLLPCYDLGYWSRADLYNQEPPMPASKFYHNLHVAQLRVLARLTSRPIYQEYADHWADAALSPINRVRAYFNKVCFKFSHY